jgi:hypothetical protein
MTVFSPSFKGSDQADGLRRLFAAPRQQIVPVAANRQVDCAGVLLERLSLAFSNLGAHVFVIDAADSSPQPHELVDIDLPAASSAWAPACTTWPRAACRAAMSTPGAAARPGCRPWPTACRRPTW